MPPAECVEAVEHQLSGNFRHNPALAGVCAKFVEDVKVSSPEELSRVLTALVPLGRSVEMAAHGEVGVDPST
jgi:hypothetical protein